MLRLFLILFLIRVECQSILGLHSILYKENGISKSGLDYFTGIWRVEGILVNNK